MSDTPSAFPPPPPASAPPPGYQPAPSPLPNYQPPPMAQPPAGYPQQPWQPSVPAVGAGVGTVGFLSQFSGPALWAIGVGAVTVVVPIFFNRIFFFLPIIGVIYGVRAIQRGKLIGGIIGIVLSAIGGILTLFGLFG